LDKGLFVVDAADGQGLFVVDAVNGQVLQMKKRSCGLRYDNKLANVRDAG
jgi:hypothetical protein